MTDRLWAWDAHAAAYEALRAQIAPVQIGPWNDAQESAGPVIAALRAAADEAERAA